MSAEPIAARSAVTNSSGMASSAGSSMWGRLTKWASEHKAVVYTVGTIATITTGAGIAYYLTRPSDISPRDPRSTAEKKKSKKERRIAKKQTADLQTEPPPAEPRDAGKSPALAVETVLTPLSDLAKPAAVEAEPDLPQIDEATVDSLPAEERKQHAATLKVAGNKAFGSKNYNAAIDLYSKAIVCKPDPIFYSNRAACYNALGDWAKVIEDTTAALALDSEYVKALNRRGNAYEKLENYSEALLDYTASCIIDGFRNEQSAQSVERLLKKLAEQKGKAILAGKEKKLPSAGFISNYLNSFRPKPDPTGMDSTPIPHSANGKGHMRAGLNALKKKTAAGYEEAAQEFEKAIEAGGLDTTEAVAYNLRGTFRYLRGDNLEALGDLSKSIELWPQLTQSYVKRASIHLELGDRDAATKDFEDAISVNPKDGDIFYHRAQLHFILGEFAEAAQDYQTSIDIDPKFIFSHIQLGVTQYKMGSVASSMATFRRCVKNFDRVPDVYNYYGELLLDQQKYEEAVEKFDMAVEMEKQTKPLGMNVLPLINKALALFQWKQDFNEAEKLCQKALIIDPECDIAVATMAQLLLQQGNVTEALEYFERAASLSRTEAEIVNALSYAEATRTQLQVQQNYPQLAARLQGMSAGLPSMR
ncbi:MAG: TOM (translocase of outer membrane) complex component [Thelocarpon impressellum]|nr:MAG: TOM (translocase of outer membrane) complex component [Thelocarpon impressellum]